MRRQRLATRRYAPEDQRRFAALSGDYNPLHLDPIAARRTLLGQPVVHGIHLVLWALEAYAARLAGRGDRAWSLRSLTASFSKPAFVGEPVAADLVADTDGSAHVQVTAAGEALADVRFRRGPRRAPGTAARGIPGQYSRVPESRSAHDLQGAAGIVDRVYEPRALRRQFPAACAVLGVEALSGLMALSRLVGMHCPGLDSLFAALDVTLVPDDTGRLAFTVERLDPRFSLVHMRVAGAGLSGTVRAFLRPSPREQPSMEQVAHVVTPRELEGQRALIVGGSRGLGELTAKIVAAGGGEPVITYRDGQEDARRVVSQVEATGRTCRAIQLDVARPRRTLGRLAGEGWAPTHLYYFATPKIFVRRQGLFDARLFRRFTAVYLDGFSRTYEACRGAGREPLRVFYPSSVAVEEDVKELGEYAAAKAAGEALCRHLGRFGRQTHVLVERLPRLDTDQTATLLGAPTADALQTMYAVVRKLASL